MSFHHRSVVAPARRAVALALPLLCVLAATAPAQFTADSLIARSLATVDLPSFEWQGVPEPMPIRLGIYTTPLPYDSLSDVKGIAPGTTGWRIWHLMPNWSADRAGLRIGDVILDIDGLKIGDSSFSGDEYMAMYAKRLADGKSPLFRVARKGVVRSIPVPLIRGTRTPMPWRPRERLAAGQGESWLMRTLRAEGLVDWTRAIQKQMRIVADQDFSTVRFTERPSPWRLDAVTYLHHHPTHVAALSRDLVERLWRGERIWNMLDVAGEELGLALPVYKLAPLPTDRAGIGRLLGELAAAVDAATRPVQDSALIEAHLAMLDPDRITEESTSGDPEVDRKRRVEEEARLAGYFARADSVDLAALLNSARLLSRMADDDWMKEVVERAARERDRVGDRSGVEGEVVAIWESPAGRCVIGGAGSNRYTGDFAFILDADGDDAYDLTPLPPGRLRFVADMGGNDSYHSSRDGLGGAIAGVDLLIDLSGDDTYRGGSVTEGSALFGVGVLVDDAGRDIYAGDWMAQGAGYHGVGLLFDTRGDDLYGAQLFSQGFGYVRGVGVVMDREGNDAYRAGWRLPDDRYPGRAHLAMSQGFGFGMRPWSHGIGADGGIGVLTDLTGNDTYSSDYFSQGGSYWYALGILHDAAGYDRYTAGQYSQGSGIHLSFGALLDDAGDDSYDAYAGLEQGNAHDWSAGCLEDASGNDTYRGSNSSQGSALTVSIAWLLDGGGNDQYYALLADTTNSIGGGRPAAVREAGSLGLLIDLGGGRDWYMDPRVIEGSLLKKSGRGLVFDE